MLPNAWAYAEHATSAAQGTDTWSALPWTPGRRASPRNAVWPPAGTRLSVRFSPPAGSGAELAALNVTMVYELYTGAPLMSKWLEVSVLAGKELKAPLMIEQLSTELLGVNCDFGKQGSKNGVPALNGKLHLQTSAAHGSVIAWTAGKNISNDPGACEPVAQVGYGKLDGSGALGEGGLGVSIGAVGAGHLSTPTFASYRGMLMLHGTMPAYYAAHLCPALTICCRLV